MVFHQQTVTGKRGDCWRAALASLLGLPLEDVPDFVNDPDFAPRWLEESQEFVAAARPGFELRELPPEFAALGEVVIAVGPSPRLEASAHAVLVDAGALVHDPHPDGTGIPSIDYILALREQGSR